MIHRFYISTSIHIRIENQTKACCAFRISSNHVVCAGVRVPHTNAKMHLKTERNVLHTSSRINWNMEMGFTGIQDKVMKIDGSSSIIYNP